MSAADKTRWNERYHDGTEAGTASALLVRWCPAVGAGSVPRAVDVACGRGRNALYLAGRGFAVDAVDISNVALDGLRRDAADVGPGTVDCVEIDLDDWSIDPGSYDLIVMMRYKDTALLSRLAASLAPGGRLIVETHLATASQVSGPRSPAFRVQPGEIRLAAGDLEIRFHREGLVTTVDGRVEALAQLVADRPPPS